MGALFSKNKPKSRVTEQDKAVLQLKTQRDKLKQYQKKIQNNLAKERELAKTLLKDGKKDRALLLLKKKRAQENMLAKTDTQLDNIEQLCGSLEFAQIESKVVEGLKAGNESLKQLQKMTSLEDVERIMDETREAVEYQNEIDALISGANLTEEDEDAIMAELDEITKIDLPEVPTEKLPDVVAEKEVEEEEEEDVPTVDVAEAEAAADKELEELELPDVPQEAPKEKKKERKRAEEERTPVLAA